MKVRGIVGLGCVVAVGLSSGHALAQDEDLGDSSAAPAAPAPAPSSQPEAAPAEPAPKTAAPARVVWKDDYVHTEAPEQAKQPPPAPTNADWSLGSSHFVLSIERITSLLSWSKKVTTQPTNGIGDPISFESTGVDASFLGAGALRSLSGIPRVAFDAIFDGGFSLGGSLSYMTTSGSLAANSVQPGATLPDANVFLFAPRIGVLIDASDSVGFWLRGGFTHFSSTASTQVADNGGLATEKDSISAWDVTLDPTLVLVAAPRVVFTVSGLLEVGVAGTVSAEIDSQSSAGQNTSAELDYDNKSFGVTAGMAAMF